MRSYVPQHLIELGLCDVDFFFPPIKKNHDKSSCEAKKQEEEENKNISTISGSRGKGMGAILQTVKWGAACWQWQSLKRARCRKDCRPQDCVEYNHWIDW